MPETLVLGQVADAAAPITAAAEVYYQGESYGQSVGTDIPLLVETSDLAPGGPVGRFLLRRISVPLRYGAASSVKVTAVTDFVRLEQALTKTYSSPSVEQEDILDVSVARACTVIRALVEVMDRSGRVSVFTPSAVGKPMTTGAAFAGAD